MANIRSITIRILQVLIFIAGSNALFEDQVGKFDWKRLFIGKVKHAHFDNKRLFVTTNENVVACLNSKTGNILWRQILESPTEQQPHFLHFDKDLITVTGAKNSFYIRGWDPPTGTILFEWTLFTERIVESLWMVQEDELYHIFLIPNSHVEVSQYSISTGAHQGKTKKISAEWVEDIDKCTIASPYLTCLSSGQLFWVNILEELETAHSTSIRALLGTDSDLQLSHFKDNYVLILKNTDATLIEIKEEESKALPYKLLSSATMIDGSIFQLEKNLQNSDKLISVKSMKLSTGEEEFLNEINYPLGLGAPYIVAGQCKNGICDVLLLSTDNALVLIRLPEGRELWTREEALSDIAAIEFFELPVSELDASIENEFKTSDILSMFLHRISTQSKQLYSLLLGGQLLSSSGLVRDEFGLHKIIVAATTIGKLFAIDTLTGSIVWSYRLPNVKPLTDLTTLFVQRTARYAPLAAQCLLLAEDSNTGLGVLFKFDPITGVSDDGIVRLDYKIKQALLLPHEDKVHLKPVLVVTGDNTVKIYPPDDATIAKENAHSVFIYMIDSKVRGFKLDANLKLTPTWEVNLGPSVLAGMSIRPSSEHIHSQGRVLPDRQVYFKYVNPNLVAIATWTKDPIHKHVLSVYLIDGVTGLVLYSSSHKRAKGPVHLVHSENWLVYTFFNERARRNEIVATELYEGNIQTNSTAFSSFAISQLPDIHSQSYILPANPVTMAVTLTERGITSKFLLVGLSSGGVAEIPWLLLQPRFENIPCGPEESCIPYMPEVPLPPEHVINYNQTLERIKSIAIAPARLESTSHVLVYGLDIFYTRVAPSKTFDVLKEDFDHTLIVLVLSGLIIASCVTKFLASKKTRRQAWK